MGRGEEAYHYLRRATKTCELVKIYDRQLTLMDHHQMAYKIEEKSAFSLQSKYYFN
jgi:hypothetical protein